MYMFLYCLFIPLPKDLPLIFVVYLLIVEGSRNRIQRNLLVLIGNFPQTVDYIHQKLNHLSAPQWRVFEEDLKRVSMELKP